MTMARVANRRRRQLIAPTMEDDMNYNESAQTTADEPQVFMMPDLPSEAFAQKSGDNNSTISLKNIRQKRERVSAAKPESTVNLADWEGKSYHEILLHSHEAIFEMIARSQNLDRLIRYFLIRVVICAAFYGLSVGLYAHNFQMLSSAVKLPLLLLGTMGICLPALYAYNMFLGAKLHLKQTVSLILVANYALSFFLAMLSLILAFFVTSTWDKYVVSLLNVLFCSIAGLFFLTFVWKGMRYLSDQAGQQHNPNIVQIWSVIYMLVGTQLAWLLRPFLGDPGEFVFFRAMHHVGGTFYGAMFEVIIGLFNRF